jgi:hypothetical protein
MRVSSAAFAGLLVVALAQPIAMGAPSVASHSTGRIAEVSNLDYTNIEPEILKGFEQRYGLSEEESIRQLGIQDRLDDIDVAALDPSEVEVFTTPGEKFVVNYLTTDRAGVPAPVLEQFRALDMEQYLRVMTVPASAAELRKAQKAVATATGLKFGSSLDSATGTVLIESVATPSQNDKQKMADAVARVAPDVSLEWQHVDELPVPAVGGGLDLNDGCTAGFVVKNDSSGAYGISSAAHCPNYATYAGQALTFRAEQYAGSQDVQWFRKDSVAWEKTFYTGGGWRPVNATKPWANMNVNDWVCKYGITTHTRCGQITNRSYCAPYVAGCNSTFVIVQGGGMGNDWAEGGDSGGPVYSDNVAWGLVSGYWPGSDDRGLFMPQEFMQALGIHVAIN